MNSHLHHPANKAERQKVAHKKFKTNETKRKEAKDRSGRVFKKLTVEQLEEQEKQNELQEWLVKEGRSVPPSGTVL